MIKILNLTLEADNSANHDLYPPRGLTTPLPVVPSSCKASGGDFCFRKQPHHRTNSLAFLLWTAIRSSCH